MPANVEQIRGKKVWELYTPAGANADGFSDRDDFEQLVGTKIFHSFLVWRSKKGGPVTLTYSLTLKQLKEVCDLNQKAGVMLQKGNAKQRAKITSASRAASALVAEANDVLDHTVQSLRARVAELETQLSNRTESAESAFGLRTKVDSLNQEKRALEDALRPLLKRQSASGSVSRGNGGISIPMGGATGYKIGRRRR